MKVDEFGDELVKLLGLEGRSVTEININVKPRELPVIEVTMIMLAESGLVLDLIKKYEIKPKEDSSAV